VRRPSEPIVVLGLFLLVTVAIWVTYARLPPSELYNVSDTGFWAGGSRALVFLNFSTALVGIALAVLAADALGSRAAAGIGVAAVGLCAVVFWPGVVDQSNLDARAINALPAVGVGLAAALTLAATGAERSVRRLRGDPIRLLVGMVLVVGALPWIAAELGFSFDGVPVLGTLFQTGELRHEPDRPGLHVAVHHGHHHGLDGVLLATAALLLSRRLRAVSRSAVRIALSLYLALMLAYGIANALQDFWLEQVVKRGWTNWRIPGVLHPELSWGWAAILLGALVVWFGWFRRTEAAT
jgi:hypothetical protein